LCQRYCYVERGAAGEYSYFATGGAYNGTQGRFFKQLPVTMRAKPTFSVTGNTYVDGVNFVSLNTLAMEYGTPAAVRLGYTQSGAGNGSGQATFLAKDTSLDATLFFFAEL
jgi:hypothetical protein